MKVIATAKGYFGQMREPGDEFEVPDDTKKASWFVKVKADSDEKPAKAGKGGKSEPDADPI